MPHAAGWTWRHTPGHSILRISSGKEQLLLVADSVHNVAIQTARPEITFVFDADGAQARLVFFRAWGHEQKLIPGATALPSGTTPMQRDDISAVQMVSMTDGKVLLEMQL